MSFLLEIQRILSIQDKDFQSQMQKLLEKLLETLLGDDVGELVVGVDVVGA